MLVSRFIKRVAQGHCKRVRGVERLRFFSQVQQLADHQLDLGLVCLPITHHRLLDLQGGVLSEWNSGLRSRKYHDSTGLAEEQRALDVSVMKDLLDDHRLG